MASTIKKIGHASISENGTANGTAGDSTGREVYTIENYNISNIDPYIVLRPKSTSIITGSVAACKAGCENNHIGYSQSGRNTLYNLAKNTNFDLASITTDCNTDCSAFMTVCAIAGGARITYGSNAPTTSNMRTRFSQSGDYEVLTSTKYTTKTDYLKAGDILVHENTHTIMVLENGEGDIDDDEVTHNLLSYNVLTRTSAITENSAVINISTIKQLNAVESKYTNKNWTYSIEYKKLPSGTLIERDITDSSIKLIGLEENTCYMYRIKVKNADTTLFYSAYKTFNTLKVAPIIEDPLVTVGNKRIDAIYVKTADGYKSVIAHLTKGV